MKKNLDYTVRETWYWGCIWILYFSICAQILRTETRKIKIASQSLNSSLHQSMFQKQHRKGSGIWIRKRKKKKKNLEDTILLTCLSLFVLSKSLTQKHPNSWGSRPLVLLFCIGRASTWVGITGMLWFGNGRGGGFGTGAVADLTDEILPLEMT